MKKIFTLFTSLFLTLVLLAADRPKSTLTIKSADQSDITVVIDGRRFDPNDNYVRIRDMQPGYHSIKVYRARNFGIFTVFGHRYDVVFNNSMFMKPFSNVMISIDRFGRAQVFENNMGRRRDWNDGDVRHDHDWDFGRGHNDGDYGDRDRGGSNDRDSRWGGDNRGSGYGSNGGYDDNGGYSNGGNFGRTLSDVEFNSLLDNISRERSESNMMKSATQIITTNYFSSAQVKEILQLFSSDDNKLAVAELAYDKTVDQRNYFVVNDVFRFNNSKDELARYIRMKN